MFILFSWNQRDKGPLNTSCSIDYDRALQTSFASLLPPQVVYVYQEHSFLLCDIATHNLYEYMFLRTLGFFL